MSTITTDAFGAKVEEYRTRLGLLQKELAGKVGLSPSHLNRIEKGTRKRPGVETVRRMIKALRLTHSEAKELVQLANLSPLVLQQNNFKEKKDVKARGNKDTEAEEPGGGQSRQPTQKAALPSTRLNSPAPTSSKEMLKQRLAMLDRMLRNAHEQVGELNVLLDRMQED